MQPNGLLLAVRLHFAESDMPTNSWSATIRARAAEVLGRIRAEDGDTPLRLLLDLRSKGFTLRLDGESIKVTPGGVPADLAAKLRQHKFFLVILLRPMPKPTFPIDWRQEWQLEMDSVYRRQAGAWSSKAKAALAEIAGFKCETEHDWQSLFKRIIDTELGLRNTGDLPPIAYADGGGTISMADGRTESQTVAAPAHSAETTARTDNGFTKEHDWPFGPDSPSDRNGQDSDVRRAGQIAQRPNADSGAPGRTGATDGKNAD
jgi:hypothetical protein